MQSSILGSVGCIYFNRTEAKDRAIVGQKLASFLLSTLISPPKAYLFAWRRIKKHVQDPESNPLLIFPEGTCVNNEYIVMFKKVLWNRSLFFFFPFWLCIRLKFLVTRELLSLAVPCVLLLSSTTKSLWMPFGTVESTILLLLVPPLFSDCRVKPSLFPLCSGSHSPHIYSNS